MTIMEWIALLAVLPLIVLVALIFWPLVVCLYLDSPAIGVLAQVIWFAVIGRL